MIKQEILEKLNAETDSERLANLKEVLKTAEFPPANEKYINNHIHTTYSFSPYSPTAAVFAAKAEGLCTAGIVDHDSISGAREFIEAGKILDLPTTVGMECRVSMKGTSLENKRTNNPDQPGISYMTIQAVPHDKIEELNGFFAKYRKARNERNVKMTERINALLPDINLSFEGDVLPESRASEGGGVTERHLMYALAKKMVKKHGKGKALIEYLKGIGLSLSEKQEALLSDEEYPFFEYDLLNILKASFIPKIYIDADEECPSLPEVVALTKKIGAVLCYAYLGDVGESVTGDKAAQKFEDDYLDELFDCLKAAGVPGVTYMPTRNTEAQLERLRALCKANGIFEVSGEDINSPRQSFVIKAMENPRFANLIEATWTLIDIENGKRKAF